MSDNKDSDVKYEGMRATVEKIGCNEHHNILENCLKANHKDWRICNNEVIDLGKCMRLNRNKINT